MKRHAAPIIVAILLLLPVLYVGSYLALVSPGNKIAKMDLHGAYYESYRLDTRWCELVFWPLEQVDRKLRPAVWEPLIIEVLVGHDRRLEQ